MNRQQTPLDYETGQIVRTPSGHFASVVYAEKVGDHVEVSVRFAEGEVAAFRACLLRPMP